MHRGGRRHISDALRRVLSSYLLVDCTLVFLVFSATGLLFMKTPSYWCRDFHYKPETVIRPFLAYNGDPYTYKMVFL